jgi:hypothetical protein
MTEWIQTRSGKKLTPRTLAPEQVGNIHEIAHALAQEFRFSRQTLIPYSVAEHCVRGSRLLPAAFAGAFLLHELSEVYLPDVPAPLKPFLSVSTENGVIAWTELEGQHTATILKALGLSSLEPLIYSPEIRRMDLAMLAAEKRDLMSPEPEPWGLTVEPANTGPIAPWAPAVAAVAFVARFQELFDTGV